MRISARYCLFLLLATSFGLMFASSWNESAIVDELAHIPAGYGYVKFLDYRLNPEHPPIVKALAALPLIILRPSFPDSSRAWQNDVNNQWEIGSQFLYRSGNNAQSILRVSRLFPIFLTLVFLFLIYFWAKEIIGKWWALLPTALFGLSPTTLAHGHYVTTDVGAALGVTLATFFFIRFLKLPSLKNILFAGIALGIALGLKFSTVLLLPYFAVLTFFFAAISARRAHVFGAKQKMKLHGQARGIHYYGQSLLGLTVERNPAPENPIHPRASPWFSGAWIKVLLFFTGKLALIFSTAILLVIYPIYSLLGTNYPIQKQITDTSYILGSFSGGPVADGESCRGSRCLAELDIWLASHISTRPLAQYFLGVLMVIQRSAGGNTSYFLGKVSAAGSRLYFPTVYLLKESLPVLLLTFLALITALSRIFKNLRASHSLSRNFWNYAGLNFPEFAMALFIFVYSAYSIQSPLNIGFRHLLPVLPLAYILTAKSIKSWIYDFKTPAYGVLSQIAALVRFGFSKTAKTALICALLVWFVLETTFAFPYFLSYFNQIGGGINGGYRFVTDSNYDWGQDLLRLKKFLDAHPKIDRIAVDYFGGGSPEYYLGSKYIPWLSARGNPSQLPDASGQLPIHWLAVSVNTLQGSIQPVAPGFVRNSQDEYGWLKELKSPKNSGVGILPTPDFRAGTSIFIYKL